MQENLTGTLPVRHQKMTEKSKCRSQYSFFLYFPVTLTVTYNFSEKKNMIQSQNYNRSLFDYETLNLQTISWQINIYLFTHKITTLFSMVFDLQEKYWYLYIMINSPQRNRGRLRFISDLFWKTTFYWKIFFSSIQIHYYKEEIITFPNGWNIFSPCFLYIMIMFLTLLVLEITWKLPIDTSASSLSFTVMIRDLEKLLNTSCPCLPNAFNGLNELDETLLSVVVIHSSLIISVLSNPFMSTHPCSSVVACGSSTDRKALLRQS